MPNSKEKFREKVGIPFEIPIEELIENVENEERLEGKIPYVKIVLNNFLNNNYFQKWNDLAKQLIENKEKLIKDIKEKHPNAHIKDLFTETSNYLFKSYLNQIKNNYQVTYIPILRSLRQTENSETAYKDRAIKDYFKDFVKSNEKQSIIKEPKEIDVFTGEELYRDVKQLLLSDYSKRQIIIQFENLLSKYFFNGMQVSIIPREYDDKGTNNKDLFIKIGNEKEFPIYELGDGIQTIIFYTFPLFKHQDKKHFLFIEEPEQNLHPGMQRILLEILNDEIFKNVTVFFTTHSNHLLDTTIESSKQTSIFSFQKDKLEKIKGNEQIPTFKIDNLKSSKTDILNNLGVRNSSVFLANCTIWVEGITDRKYIKQFLKMYLQKKNINYYEDLHYSFIEYAGANIEHWNFSKEKNSKDISAQNISNRIFLIADSDIKKVEDGEKDDERYFNIDGQMFEIGKWKRHNKLKDNLGANYHRLDSKEIENLLTPEVIKGAIGEYRGEDIDKLKFKNDLKDIKFVGINKKEVIRPIYWWQNIGEFIDENIEGTKKTYTEENSIKDKTNFCNKAITYMESQKENWKENYDKLLSNEAQELCEKIHGFIKSHNENLS